MTDLFGLGVWGHETIPSTTILKIISLRFPNELFTIYTPVYGFSYTLDKTPLHPAMFAKQDPHLKS